MEYKILEANGVENENVDGAAFNNFTARNQDGILSGVLNECSVYSENNTTVIVDTGELIIRGFRVKITDPYSVQRTASASDIQYHIVGKIILYSDRSVLFSVECRPVSPLMQDSIYTQEYGTYEVEIARFQTGPSGVHSISNSLKIIGVPQEITNEYMLSVYPVGSIYISTGITSPASLFGGIWERIKDRFLLGSGDTYTAGTTGGSATHTLTVEEMPSHYHDGIKSPNNYHLVGESGGEENGRTTSSLDFVKNFDALHTNNAGGGQPHNNMPPYIAVNIWKRIA